MANKLSILAIILSSLSVIAIVFNGNLAYSLMSLAMICKTTECAIRAKVIAFDIETKGKS